MVLLDASARGTIRLLIEAQVKNLVEKMCLNENRSKSERGVKVESTSAPKGVLALDIHTALLAQV